MSWLRKVLGASLSPAGGLPDAGVRQREMAEKLTRFYHIACFLGRLTRVAPGASRLGRETLRPVLESAWRELGIPFEGLGRNISCEAYWVRALTDHHGEAAARDAARRDAGLRHDVARYCWRALVAGGGDGDRRDRDTMFAVGSELGMTEAEVDASSVPFVRRNGDAGSGSRSDCCRRLGVDHDAGTAQIRRAFRKLTLKYHPDRHAAADPVLRKLAEEQFVLIRSAYEALTNGSAHATTGLVGLGLNGSVVAARSSGVVCFFCNRRSKVGAGGGEVSARCDGCQSLLLFDRATADGFRKRWASTFQTNGHRPQRRDVLTSFDLASGNETAATFFDRGVAHLRAERFDRAVDPFKRTIRLDPMHVTAHFNLGVAYGRLDRHEEAVGSFREAVRLNPSHATAHLNMGLSCSHLGCYEEAIEPLKRAVRLVPHHPTAHVSLGHSYWQLGCYAEARQSLEQGLRLKADDASAHRLLGIVCMNLDQHGRAADAFRMAIKLDASDASALKNLGRCCIEEGLDAEACAVLERAAELDPKDATVHVRWGNSLLALGRDEEAVAAYARAVDCDSHCAAAHFNLGMCFVKSRDFAKACDAFEKVVRAEAEDAVAHRLLGSAYLACGRAEEAVEVLRRATELDSGNASAHFRLGEAYLRSERFEDAAQAFADATGVSPDSAPAHFNRALALWRLGRGAEAASALERGLACCPEDAAARRQLGSIYCSLGRHEDAAGALREAIRLSPDDAEAHLWLSVAFAGMKVENQTSRVES